MSPAYFKASMYWSINENSAVKDAAALFINFFTNDKDCFDIVGIDRAMPISSEMLAYITPNLDETSSEGSRLPGVPGPGGQDHAHHAPGCLPPAARWKPSWVNTSRPCSMARWTI